jgi:hypothetical protein
MSHRIQAQAPQQQGGAVAKGPGHPSMRHFMQRDPKLKIYKEIQINPMLALVI